MKLFSYKGGCGVYIYSYSYSYVNVCILKHLKEELAWAINKQLRVISNKMLFKIVILLRN